MKIEYRPVELADIDDLVARMRPADAEELEASSSIPARDIANMSVRHSIKSASAFINGRLACIIGVCPISILGGHGCPWLLGTTTLADNPKAILSQMRPLLDEICETFPVLENHVYSGNIQAIRFLRRAGFSIHEAEPWGEFGLPFHRFTKGVVCAHLH